MHEWAEEGIAAHWRYKEGRAFSSDDEDQIKKLRDLLDAQQEIENPREFMSNLKVALFPEEVYVFTPNGDVRSFPKGATPIDFAYSIHTDIGNQCIGAKVNRSIVPLKYQLQNGDTVEIITQAGHHPSKDWLKYRGHLPRHREDQELGQDRGAQEERRAGPGSPGKGIQKTSPEVRPDFQNHRKCRRSTRNITSIPSTI